MVSPRISKFLPVFHEMEAQVAELSVTFALSFRSLHGEMLQIKFVPVPLRSYNQSQNGGSA